MGAVRQSWWRRNLVPLIATAVLIPATAVVVSATEWTQYFAERPTQAVAPGADGEIELGGMVIGPVDARLDQTPEVPVPEGAVTVVVTIPIDPQGAELTCYPLELRDAQDRSWKVASDRLGGTAPDVFDRCTSILDSPYEIVAPFVVPVDAVDSLHLRVAPLEGLPGFARIPLDL